MRKLKIGDKFVYTKEMEKAKRKRVNNNASFFEQIGEELVIKKVIDEYYCAKPLVGAQGNFYVNCIDPFLPRLKITWGEVKEGDFIENRGVKRKILGRLNDVIFMSDADNFNVSSPSFYTISELRQWNYLIVQPIQEETNEMTLDEVCKALGKTIKIVKSK